MRAVDHRRYPNTITRLRPGPTMYNFFNEALPLVYAEASLRSSVQPIGLEYNLGTPGVGFAGRLRAFVPDGQNGENRRGAAGGA